MPLSGTYVSESDLLTYEKNALDKIKRYMLQNFDDRQRQTNDLKCSNTNDTNSSISSSKMESLLKEQFWPNVVRSFTQYFETVDLHFEGIFITGETQQTIIDYIDNFSKETPHNSRKRNKQEAVNLSCCLLA